MRLTPSVPPRAGFVGPFMPAGDAAGAVTRATPADLAYVVHLQKRNTDALGFLPRVALEEKIRLGRVWLARENDEPAGFLHHGTLATPEVRVFQAAIQYDARRRHLGLSLVGDLLARATAAGARGVSLRCLSFLDANTFWRQAGFTLMTSEPGAKGTLNVWTKRLDDEDGSGAATGGGDGTFAFASRLHPCPSCGQMTMDTWTRGARRWHLCPRCVARADPG